MKAGLLLIAWCVLMFGCHPLDKKEREQIEVELFQATDAIIKYSQESGRDFGPPDGLANLFAANRSFYNKVGAVYQAVLTGDDSGLAEYKTRYDSLRLVMQKFAQEPSYDVSQNDRVTTSLGVTLMSLDIALLEYHLINEEFSIPDKKKPVTISQARLFNTDENIIFLSHSRCSRTFIVRIDSIYHNNRPLAIYSQTHDSGEAELHNGSRLAWSIAGEKALAGLLFRNIGAGSYLLQGYMSFDGKKTTLPFEYQFKMR